MQFTKISEISGVVSSAREAFEKGTTTPIAWRIQQITQIKKALLENKEIIIQALQADLRRPAFETFMAEIMTVVGECDFALANLKSWVKPERVGTPAVMLPGSSYIHKDPLGTVLIIAPWNFPVQLVFSPMLAAISAGNAVVVKPSEVSTHSSMLIEQLINKYLDKTAIKVVQAEVEGTSALLKERFDHIFYTGNSFVAKIVMEAAAKHLTPTTLELGGKSPAIVSKDCNLELTAMRLIGSKCLNAGQICIAPDYVFVERGFEQKLISALVNAIAKTYGPDIRTSKDFGRIINERQFSRLAKTIDECKDTIVHGGRIDSNDFFVEPTIFLSPPLDSELMRSEIFGPLLPIVVYDTVQEAVQYIRKNEKPLALYIFSSSSKTQKYILENTTSGGAVVNDCVVHNANPHLPFGGVGNSGMGAYHGKFGFDTFSHRKAVFYQSTLVDSGPLRFPPYSPFKTSLLDFAFKASSIKSPIPLPGWKNALIFGLSTAVVLLSLHAAGKLPDRVK